MPVYQVQAPDGSTMHIEGPEGATNEQIFAAAQSLYQAAPAQPVEGIGQRAARTVGDLGRQLGLTARAGIGGIGDLIGIGSEPIRIGLEAIGMPRGDSASRLADRLSNAIGLPSPQNEMERIGQSGARTMAGVAGLAGASGAASKALSGTAQSVAGQMSAAPIQQAAGGAAGGMAGQVAQESNADPVTQFAASMVGAFGGAAGAAGAERAANAIAAGIRRMVHPRMGTADVQLVLNGILAENGINLGQVSGAVRAQLAQEVQQALSTGKQVNPDVVRRIADYGVTGLTPTRGTVTLDPVQITQERNLAKLGANSQDPRLQELAQVRNRNNARLIANLDEMGAAGRYAGDRVAAGEAVTRPILTQDAAMHARTKALYDTARDASGRYIPLDREGFVENAYRNLAEGGKGAFLPDNILKLLEQLRTGKATMGMHGPTIDTPFDVQTIDNLETLLATASRSTQDGNAKAAIMAVREALNDVRPSAQPRLVGGNQLVPAGTLEGLQSRANQSADDALKAFRAARAAHRERMQWQESTPGIQAVIDESVPSERFVEQFFISRSNKSGAQQAAQLVEQIKSDPSAKQAMREAVLEWIKAKSLGDSSSEVGIVSQKAMNRALKQLGDEKLSLLFSKDELAALKANARVASYDQFQPAGSAVNNSNTASAAAGMLERVAGNPLVSRIPFGQQIVREPALAWSGQIQAQQALTPLSALVREASRPVAQRMPLSSLLAIPLLQQDR